MNKYIEESLNKELYKYSKEKNKIIIYKQEKVSFEESSCYLIKVDNYILNPPKGFDLHDKWNKGIKPKHKYMKIEVTDILGKMIKVRSIGYDIEKEEDIDDIWQGWLPEKSITLVKKL